MVVVVPTSQLIHPGQHRDLIVVTNLTTKPFVQTKIKFKISKYYGSGLYKPNTSLETTLVGINERSGSIHVVRRYFS